MTRLAVLFVRMLRYRVAAMVWMFMLLAAAYRGGLHDAWDYVWAALTLGASYVAATTVNDIADRDIDRINHPRDRGRPLVTREASERDLVVVHALACPLALAAAAPLGVEGVVLAAVSLAIGWAYSLPPVRLCHRTWLAPVALGIAYVLVPYALGLVAAGVAVDRQDGLFAGALFALFVARIVLKDFRDRAGDAAYGKPTLLLRFGKDVTCLVSAGALASGNALLLAAIAPPLPLALVVEFFVVAIACCLLVLRRASEARAEQLAIGLGARMGNGLLVSVLAWLVLEARGATLAEQSGFALVLAGAFALACAAVAARPDAAVVGYKG